MKLMATRGFERVRKEIIMARDVPLHGSATSKRLGDDIKTLHPIQVRLNKLWK